MAFGGLDVVINNAGYMGRAKPVVDSDPEEYWMTWEINYRGVYWVTKYFLPLLLKKEDGLKTIVNLSSKGAHALVPGMSAYQVSKFAILKFSESVCAEYAGVGVVAYSVHPGGVPTELALNMPKAMHRGEWCCRGVEIYLLMIDSFG
jgi:NAD(P)-dependent dehydrogenase (short-subunit alcohol dehydrogenase family)